MARIIPPLLRSGRALSQFQSYLQNPNSQFQPRSSSLPKTLTQFTRNCTTTTTISSTSYVREMRKSTFKGTILRLLRDEIRYELVRPPLSQPTAEINGFKVYERPGEQWTSLEKQYGEKEEIKIEVTMFDGSVPISEAGEKSGQLGQEVQLHITMIVSIFKEECNQVLELVCSAWPDTIEIDRFYVRERAKMPHQPYSGPRFRELDDELQDSLYEYLEERGIDDSLCAFLHKYMKYKDKDEYLRWVKSVKSLVENGA